MAERAVWRVALARRFGVEIGRCLVKCPVCQETLTMSERQGVEIDFCPKCRGVWLDRGELDKILAREASLAGGPVSRDPDRRRDGDDDDDRYPRRRSMWRDLFD